VGLRVGLDATSAARQNAGIGRYCRQLLAALSTRDDPFRFRVFYCGGGVLHGHLPPMDSRFRVRSLPISDRVLNAMWHRARLPLPVQLVIGRIDVFHSPDFSLPPTGRTPTILTIHDLAFLREPDCAFPSLRDYLARVVPRGVRNATHIVAVSENTKSDLVELFDTSAEKITTIYEGVDGRFRPSTDISESRDVLGRHGVCDPYILSVGTLEPRKNYVRLLEAYAQARKLGIRQLLVIAGGEGWLFEPIYRRIRELHLADYVKILHPDDALLLALYQSADLFIFPSLYEGFGLPVLEALACGTPVACSNSSAMPEVVGECAITFDPRDVDGIANALRLGLTDEPRRRSLTLRGPEQAAHFPWSRAAAQTADLYRSVANHA
jgi:glycosyltransferase involved in cell wall biosynthesis